MKTIRLGLSNLQVPTVAIGCLPIDQVGRSQAERFVRACLEAGAYFFDHADIYGDGRCEEIFADVIGMNSSVRDKIILQSKCGIVKNRMYDFSLEHILTSIDGSLRRLKTDHLDVLVLHRPDALVEPEEVAAAFDILEQSGKVKYFGVSNQKPMQIKLLRKFVTQPLVVNQLQLSVAFATMIANGLHVNMLDANSLDHDGSILDYCRYENITIQAWSPFQFGFFKGVFLDNPQFPELNEAIDKLGEKYGVSNTAIAIAWLLRHPARIQPIAGTMNIARMQECVKAADIALTREEWYSLYLAAGNMLP